MYGDSIKEIERGHGLVVKKDGSYAMVSVKPQLERKACSFERIYFSRGNDQDIYQERMNGETSVSFNTQNHKQRLKKHRIFFYSNTAEVFLWHDEGHE